MTEYRYRKRKARLLSLLLLPGLAAGLWGCGASVPPDDPLYPEQGNLAQIQIEDAWEAGLTGKGVTIGLIDTGVAKHKDLDSRRISGKSYTAEDSGDYTDTRGHGTFLAGLLAARRDNGKGIAGMTDSKLRIYQVLGSQPHIGLDHVAQAIRDATDDGCDVINLSMGTPNEDDNLKEAVEYALDSGVIVIAAAGGDSGTLYYPAAYDGVVGVDGLTEDLEPMETSADNESVDVTAPGEGIISLDLTGGYDRDGAGASYAAAQVTAAAAFARQKDPEIDGESFLELLKKSVQDLGGDGYDTVYGWGVLDLALLTEALGEG